MTRRAAVTTGGTDVGEVGVVSWSGSPELRLRSTPSTTGNNVIGSLPFNTTVQVVQKHPGDWLYLSTASGLTGFCAAQYVWYAPTHPLPEPNAKLHRVESGAGGTAIGIAQQYYGSVANDWGQDLRFFVNVLGAVNHLSVPDSVDGWKTVAFQAGTYIWIPSIGAARAVRGQVNSGSYSHEAADAVGIAGALDRVAELYKDFQTAIKLSGKYISGALAAHGEQAIVGVLKSLALMAVGAVALLAVTTASGAAIGALGGGAGAAPGAAAGFEVGLALIEWIGLGMLFTALEGTAFARAFGETRLKE